MTRPRLTARRIRPLGEPDISPAYKAAVEHALRWAWDEVCSSWPDVVKSGTEEQITEKMQRILNQQHQGKRRAPGIASFETVDRGTKVTCADGRIEKQPDLVLRPPVPPEVANRGDWGVFVECKVIDRAGRHTPRAYCDDGVARFANGEYAARMPSGMMLAYVRGGLQSEPHKALGSLLLKRYGTKRHRPASVRDASESQHTRAALGHPCVDIELRHVWLRFA